jgi:hypothetical protein
LLQRGSAADTHSFHPRRKARTCSERSSAIFWMAFLSFWIFIAGLCVLFVGVLPAASWVGSSFATLYNDVLAEKAVISNQ